MHGTKVNTNIGDVRNSFLWISSTGRTWTRQAPRITWGGGRRRCGYGRRLRRNRSGQCGSMEGLRGRQKSCENYCLPAKCCRNGFYSSRYADHRRSNEYSMNNRCVLHDVREISADSGARFKATFRRRACSVKLACVCCALKVRHDVFLQPSKRRVSLICACVITPAGPGC